MQSDQSSKLMAKRQEEEEEEEDAAAGLQMDHSDESWQRSSACSVASSSLTDDRFLKHKP